MEESAIQENLGLEMSRLRGEVVEVMSGVPERGSMEEIGGLRPRVAIDLDPHFQEIFEKQGMSGSFRPETTGGISEKGHCQRPLIHSPLADEVDSEDEEGMIGILINVEEGRILKSGTM